MAITRAQQAKQMLQDGGMLVQPGFGGTRQGYRGGKDLGKGATGMGSGKTGSDQRGDLTREQFMGMKGKTRTGPKGEGDGPIEKLKTKLQTNALTTQLLNIAQKKKNIFGQIKSTLAPKGPIVAQDFVDFYNDPNLDQIGLTKNELTRANELIGGLQQIEKTGSLSQDKFEDVFFGGKTNPLSSITNGLNLSGKRDILGNLKGLALLAVNALKFNEFKFASLPLTIIFFH